MARGKTPIPLDLPLLAAQPVKDGCVTKQEGAYRALRDAILERLLPQGTRLPSSRVLAQRWRLSRGTVECAFDRLRAEGYVTRLGGSGTRVCAVIPDSYLRPAPGRAGGADAGRVASTPSPLCGVVEASAVGASMAGAPKLGAPEAETAVRGIPAPAAPVTAGAQVGVPFVAKLANPRLFSTATWVRHVQRAVAAASPEQWSSAQANGMAALREQIAGTLRLHRGIACGADDIIVTTGIRHAIDLIARSLLGPGDKVCVEDPGYRAVQSIFELAGAAPVHAPVDDEGIDIDVIRGHDAVRLAYVTPAHQSPLGVTMSASRRLALLDWAASRDAWIVEDDYDSEFNYQSSPLPALKAIDRADRVIYCGSFNQALFSNLRIGYMLAPPDVRTRVLALWRTIGRSVGVTEQLGLADFIRGGAFAQHLRVARIEYLALRDIVLREFAALAPGRYGISGSEAGFHFILWLPPGWREAAFCDAAADAGVALQALGSLCHRVVLPPAVVVGYTGLRPTQARFAARKLGRLLASEPPVSPGT
ncbi:PLP-dependent aminotransferase family protein [Robbsia sp. Bb-Pol-6]|uniref:PLP-dependent aminotransferase family protein n=1 Tax=Robbsia betulipollinis TaxID=2981849 RepID=A0ABT3ZKB6_9BURK|nr:PLP-dependent aminotransferase family protein [Robbsia betulipollinis]MCY0386730.1 PLP-dependent aminotransferase family protein [Robbsia betulipollinis]